MHFDRGIRQRGRGDSDGEFVPYRNDGRDGYDAIEWLAAQPWCTGDVVSADTDGCLIHGGRLDGLVKVGGYMVNPMEVEHLIKSLKAAGKKFEHKIHKDAPGGNEFNVTAELCHRAERRRKLALERLAR